MKWVLRKTARALDDLADIWDYIAARSAPLFDS
jgi:plasmid stabilization system protein ParE